MYCLATGIYSRHTKDELKGFLRKLDLVMVDLDGCIFPGITKVRMYRNICLVLIRSGQYLLLVRLLVGAVIIALMKIGQMLCLGITNRALILRYAKVLRPVPASYLQKAVESIPGKSFPGARETLEILSEKARLGIISQSLDIVLKEYVKQFSNARGSFIDFWDGNILSDLVKSGSRLKTFIFSGRDKEAPARRRVTEFRAKKMMVIGHNSDDLGMMKVAKEDNGIIVGFNPTSQVKRMCDIVITGENWMGLKQIIREII